MTIVKPILSRKRAVEKPEAQAALDALQAAVRDAEGVPCRSHPEPDLWISKKAFGEALDRRGWPVHRGTGGRRSRRGIGLAAEDGDTDE